MASGISTPAQCLRRIQQSVPSSYRPIRQLHILRSQCRTRDTTQIAPHCRATHVSRPSYAFTIARGSAFSTSTPRRQEGHSNVDEIIEEITELYATARDEFEIAAEETEKNTTYAADDRAAAREELDKLLAYYEQVQEGRDKDVAGEVRRRVGQRIRELDHAIQALEESVSHGD